MTFTARTELPSLSRIVECALPVAFISIDLTSRRHG
jgi:hypothetical protein